MNNCLRLLRNLVSFPLYTGAITGAITTPLDVIKTRLMVQVNFIAFSWFLCSFHLLWGLGRALLLMFWLLNFLQGPANEYKGIVDCVKSIVREEGTPAFFKVTFPTTRVAK